MLVALGSVLKVEKRGLLVLRDVLGERAQIAAAAQLVVRLWVSVLARVAEQADPFGGARLVQIAADALG